MVRLLLSEAVILHAKRLNVENTYVPLPLGFLDLVLPAQYHTNDK